MSTYSHGMADYLTDEQITTLLKGINPLRVHKDGKGFSHVQAYDVRAHMNRVFGFTRWDTQVLSCDLVFESESKGEKFSRWTVCYRATVSITVRSPIGQYLCTYTDVATGDATNLPSRADAHDMACKTAASQAFKRAAVNLGDQFANSLYCGGSMAPLTRGTLVGQPPKDAPPVEDMTAHITTPLAPENGEPESPQREVSSQPVPPVPAVAPVAAPVAVVEQVPPPAADPNSAEGMELHANINLGLSEEAATEMEHDAAMAAYEADSIDHAAAKAAELSPVAAAGARLLNGETLTPAALMDAMAGEPMTTDRLMAAAAQIIAEHGDGTEETAVETLTETFGEMTPVAEPAPAAAPDPFDWCLEQIAQARKVQPEMAIPMLHKVMEVAVRKQLRGRRMEGGTETLGAHLTGLMQRAGDAVAKRKAEAAAAVPSDF